MKIIKIIPLTFKSLLYIFAILILISCSSKKLQNEKHKSEIEMIIQNEQVKDSTNISIVIQNNSDKKYFLPIDTLLYRETLMLERANSFFFMKEIITDKKNQQLTQALTIYMSIYADSKHNPFNKWNQKVKNKAPKDMLLLNPKQKISISFPYTLKKESEYFDSNSQYEITNRNEPHFIHYEYNAKVEHVKLLLKPALIDSMKIIGYELYTGKIVSNKVPLILQ